MRGERTEMMRSNQGEYRRDIGRWTEERDCTRRYGNSSKEILEKKSKKKQPMEQQLWLSKVNRNGRREKRIH
jgi:hypothetical protein